MTYLEPIAIFAISAAFVSTVIVTAQRLGPRIGGHIGGLPVTFAISLFFIGYLYGPTATQKATAGAPIVLLINCFFLLSFCIQSKGPFISRLGRSLLVWAIVCFTYIENMKQVEFELSIALSIGGISLIYAIIQKLDLPVPRKAIVKNSAHFLPYITGVFSGIVVTTAVLLTYYIDAFVGGLVGMFPVVFVSTIAATAFTEGSDYQRYLSKQLLLSSFPNILLYCLIMRYSHESLGIIRATILGISIIFFSNFFRVLLRNKKNMENLSVGREF